MLHHASRLLKCHPVDTTSSFFAILQSAAACAWTRHHSSVRPPEASRKPPSVQPSRTHSRRRASWHIVPIDPDSLSIRDIMWEDPCRSEPLYIQTLPSQSTTSVSSQPFTAAPISPLRTPTSQETLYQNMLDMHNYSHSSLTTLINYHFSHPQDARPLRSTRSFNFLISLAMRKAAFGTASRLLDAMKAESVQPNIETWKLTVRWLIRTGRREEALRRIERVMNREHCKKELGLRSGHEHNKDELPLPLWVELFGSLKRGALRRWVRVPGQRGTHRRRSASFRRVVLQTRTPSASEQADHYRFLMDIFPTATPREYSKLPPRAVFFIVQSMIQLGSHRPALEATLSYLRSLPKRLRHRKQFAALDIIHLHLRAVSEKPGLARHFAQRRLLFDLLAACPGVRPSSRTLIVTLVSLRPCKRCGTLAMRCFKTFRARWGHRTESGIVRRQITSLAMKEGRADIAAVMLKAERKRLLQKQLWRTQRDVIGGASPRGFTRLLRWPIRKIFHQRGAENWKWRTLKRKVKRRR